MAFAAQELVGNSIGPYEILNVIGEGGMGIVYKGVHRTLDQEVAIKALSGGLSFNTEMRERFLQEARIQAKLTHPNIVNLLNFIEETDTFYLVMEFIEGETLEDLLKRVGLIPPEKAIDISLQVLSALHFAHEKGVIHRDIKPSNIMISKSGLVKITDFGIAKIMGSKRLTATGVRPGTLWYMSPEQVKGKDVDARSDIYSFGVTLYQVVTGKVPFDAESDYDIMRAHVEIEPIPPKEAYPHLPEYIEATILKSLAKEPSGRFQNAREMAVALQGDRTNAPVSFLNSDEDRSPLQPTLWDSLLTTITSYRLKISGVAAALLIIFFLINFMKGGQGVSQPEKTDPPPPIGNKGGIEEPEPQNDGAPPKYTVEGAVGKPETKDLGPVNPPGPVIVRKATGPEQPPSPPVPRKSEPRQPLSEDPRVRRSISEANSLRERGAYDEADSEIRKALSLDPSNENALGVQRNIAAARQAERLEGIGR